MSFFIQYIHFYVNICVSTSPSLHFINSLIIFHYMMWVVHNLLNQSCVDIQVVSDFCLLQSLLQLLSLYMDLAVFVGSAPSSRVAGVC